MNQAEFRSILARHPRQLNEFRLWRHVALDVSLWAALFTAAWFFGRGWAVIFLAPLFASLTFRAFGMMHECVHSAASSKRVLNGVLGEIYGVLCFLPFKNWRAMHLDHHMWTGNVNRDPTSKILVKFKADGFKIAGAAAWAWVRWIPLLGLMQHVVFWNATVSARAPKFLIATIVYLAFATWALGPLGLLSGILCYLCLVEAINLPHHLTMPQYEDTERTPTFEQDRFARSCIYPKWFSGLVLLNFNLHAEHHLFPSHPWYQLGGLHEDVAAMGLVVHNSLRNEWILKYRSVPLEQVLRKTFEPAEDEKKSA